MPDERAKARRASYIPLQITAWLQAPVVGDPLLPIDGVLYYAAHREALGGRTVSHSGSFTPSDGAPVGRLPLAILNGEHPAWYYAASSAQWPVETTEGTDHWVCRFDSELLQYLTLPKGRLDTAGGRYRAYHMPVFYRHALSIAWFVRGEPAAITRLLTGVTHLGKKTSQGWGAVLRWHVEPCAEDWSVTGPDGLRMRPVPDVDGLLAGIRPPYWLPRHQVPCLMPTECLISDAP